jgi:spermidine synthase
VTGRRRGRPSVTEEVDFGFAELLPDADRPGGWTLMLDGYPQSYVDTEDPGYLEFEYVRRLASIVDGTAPIGEPLNVMHLGGGALTLPRYVAATRPRSAQRVVERDAALIALVRRELPLPRNADIRVRAADARAVVESTAADRFDLVITDVYGGARVPGSLCTVEFAAQAARVLKTDGVFAMNLADGGGLAYSRAQVATLRTVFADVYVIAEPQVLRGRRFGNVILAATCLPGRLEAEELAAAARRDPFPARVLRGAEVVSFAAGARPVGDAEAHDSPAPPDKLFNL